MEDQDGPGQDEVPPDSLLPYDDWTEEALRHVVARALAYAGAQGLPGQHHFYVTFRTDQPGVVIPTRLLAQYPQEMTIVLQHQFWDLRVDEEAANFTVSLSFSGVPATLIVPLAAVTGFADPQVRFGLRFTARDAPVAAAASPEAGATPEAGADPEPEATDPAETQVVSLDAFRRRGPTKD